MGLDMYLTAKKSFFWDTEINKKIREMIPELFESGNLNFITIEFEVGYWRKAHGIHEWFVNNVQDGVDECQHTYVARDKLKKLYSQCQEILKNKDIYEEWYTDKIRYTIKVIEKTLKLPSDWKIYYQSSW